MQKDFDTHLDALISHLSEEEKAEFFETLKDLYKYIHKIEKKKN